MSTKMMQQACYEAIRKAGGARALAEHLVGPRGRRLSRQAVEHWHAVPARHVLRVEELTGVSRYRLRPDIFGCERRVA